MKNIIKPIIAFVLGIAATLAVVFIIIPKFQTPPDDAEPVDIKAQIDEAVDEAVKEALATMPPTEIEPIETVKEEEPTVTKAEKKPETTKKVEETTPPAVTAKPETSPVKQPAITQPASSAQATADEPEYFYDEDGKRYVYINGYKTYFPEGDESNASQIEYFDWPNDPDSSVPGPF
jgi:cytoskeletal protein RodZ